MKILAIIPARGGSKGIPRKNLQLLRGKPLIAHTIEQALESQKIGRIIVSTDDMEIESTALKYGIEVVKRPPEYSSDTATSESALRHVLDTLDETEAYKPELVVFLQCTSPIRKRNDIDRAIETLIDSGADSLLSVVPSCHWIWRLDQGQPHSLNYDYTQRPRRQDRPQEYDENGSIYIFRPHVLRRWDNRLGGKMVIYEMDGWSSIDVETLHDLELCEWVLSHYKL